MRRREVPAVLAGEEHGAGQGRGGEEVRARGGGADAERAGVFVGVGGCGGVVGWARRGVGPGVVALPEGEADEGGDVEGGVVDVELRF